MEKLKGYDFELKEGDLILLKKQPDGKGVKNKGEELWKKYIGVVRNYDSKNSKSGVLSNGYQIFHLSDNIREINSALVFCWYNGAFRILKEFDGDNYNIKNLDDLKAVDLYKLNEDETKKFKSLAIKTKIANSL